MTYVSSYDTALKQAVDNYVNAYLKPLPGYKITQPIPKDLVQLLSHEKEVSARLNEISSVVIQPMSFDAKSNIDSYYDNLAKQQEALRNKYMQDAEDEKQNLKAKHDIEVLEVKKYNSDLINPIKSKHEELLNHKEQLDYVFKHYDISPLDMDVSDNITVKEFEMLVDESIAVCKKYERKDNKWFNKFVEPLKGEKNLQFTLCYIGIAFIVIYFLLPILCIPAFVILFKSVHNMYKDLEKLRLASSLMSQLDYNRFIPEEQFKTVEDLDLSEVDDKLNKELDSIKDYSEERQEAISKLTADTANIAKVCNDAQIRVKTEYANVIKDLQDRLKTVKETIQSLMQDYISFPNKQNNSVVMSHVYTLGRIENRLDVTGELPCKNIVFDSSNRELAIDNMKLYLANALLSVRVKQLTVEIYDPKNMCGDFTEFFTPETKPYIKPNAMKLEDLIKTYRKYSQDNIIVLDEKTIDDFNREAEEKEIVPKEYRLLLIISEFDKLEKGDDKAQFAEYFKFSADSGVMIWLLDNKKYANSLWVDGSYTMDGEGIKYTRELGKQAVATYIKALANFKDTGIDYVSKFGDVYIPREKWWTWDTISGIAMHYGLENGDPTRGLPMFIGDANVHALLGGATGAGKSAAINQILISLITMYPPSELQIVYIDFKNVEAAKFTRGYVKDTETWMTKEEEKSLREKGIYYSRVSRIPHLRIISGTTDGEYALSVFEFLMSEMARRQEIINKFGVTKVEEMRKQILKAYNSEHGTPKGTWHDMRKNWEWYKPNVYDKYGDLPRLLVIFDEFQVMYNPEFVEQKIIDQINGKITAITKLARAMGSHFWFTSQSMKGTMSKDTIANFSLRGALRCTAEVSEELLGNPAASLIKQKFGFMYTNDSAGQNKEANRYWRVPFLDEKDMPRYIDELNNMLEEHNEKHNMAEFYDEKILVPSTQLDSWYSNYSDVFSGSDTFILGERANFSTNKAPVAVQLQEDGGENIMIAAFDRNDMLNLTMTLVDNIKKKEDVILIMNCQDMETHTLLDVENIVDPQFYPLSLPKQDVEEFITAITATVNSREERGGPYKPMYVFCIQWERAPGISVDVNYKLGDKFKDLLRRAPSVGVHFVFASRDKLDMQRYIPAACNHRIGGLLPKDAFFFIETPKVEKLPDASKDAGLFAFYEFGTTLQKFRIYQHTYTKTLKSREVIIN